MLQKMLRSLCHVSWVQSKTITTYVLQTMTMTMYSYAHTCMHTCTVYTFYSLLHLEMGATLLDTLCCTSMAYVLLLLTTDSLQYTGLQLFNQPTRMYSSTRSVAVPSVPASAHHLSSMLSFTGTPIFFLNQGWSGLLQQLALTEHMGP